MYKSQNNWLTQSMYTRTKKRAAPDISRLESMVSTIQRRLDPYLLDPYLSEKLSEVVTRYSLFPTPCKGRVQL
jgi:hypothetical protein